MRAVRVKDLPKDKLLSASVKDELLGEHNLKPTDSTVKNILPTVEDLKQEKVHQGIMDSIEGFNSEALKHCVTVEKMVLPAQEEIAKEKTIRGVLQDVQGFAKDSLKDVQTRESVSPVCMMQAEMARDSMLKTVSEFDKTVLKKAETVEKNPLPSTETIAQEQQHQKLKQGIEGYDVKLLSHTDTKEKNLLPTQEVILFEKTL